MATKEDRISQHTTPGAGNQGRTARRGQKEEKQNTIAKTGQAEQD
jgi:hypothetical protein